MVAFSVSLKTTFIGLMPIKRGCSSSVKSSSDAVVAFSASVMRFNQKLKTTFIELMPIKRGCSFSVKSSSDDVFFVDVVAFSASVMFMSNAIPSKIVASVFKSHAMPLYALLCLSVCP